jgi:prepilin-type processing-associated H-X9-DG protein
MVETETLQRRIKLAEIVIIVVSIAIVITIGRFIYVGFNSLREYTRERRCLINQREIARVALMYLQDHNKNFPAKENFWKDINIEPEYLICPTKGTRTLNSYAFNTQLDKKPVNKIAYPSKVFITCDSDAANNLWTTPADSAKRHRGYCIYSYVDGHVRLSAADYTMK